VGAAEDEHVHVHLDERFRYSSATRREASCSSQALLDERHEERAGLRIHAGMLEAAAYGEVVGTGAIVPAVPITPIRPDRVAATAARAPGSMTPIDRYRQLTGELAGSVCRGRVAGDDDHLHVRVPAETPPLRGVAAHRLGDFEP
jgi:hypothetical protein